MIRGPRDPKGYIKEEARKAERDRIYQRAYRMRKKLRGE